MKKVVKLFVIFSLFCSFRRVRTGKSCRNKIKIFSPKKTENLLIRIESENKIFFISHKKDRNKGEHVKQAFWINSQLCLQA